MNNRQLTFYWIRWLLMLPLSIAIGLAVSSLVGVVLSFVAHNYDLSQSNNASRAFITPFVSIILGYVIAPKYKIKAVVGLYCLWFFIMICCLILVISKVKLYGVEWEIKDGGLALTMVILGLTFSYVILFIIQKKE
jgi:MFS family permease